ncbi:hypothetical protein ACFORH_42775 [Amycolatopsis roodepoortensis]|uniref:Uncharacterized protein n=1 Tax=Amycolatopsis roodepoortensis TaxID=700274 RepID=A0ABR9L3A1_9PSEU|nr:MULTISPECIES: hypothetical protein [Amycolatopsis]MBE1575031.1 hypothetical protein [Amycolatopsis roodepoortensis]GHG97402.1 hypothetical protein GCM10017788_76880 [Amycolatopsis acidiphila]
MGAYPEILRRFKPETAEHEMTVAHDEGLYRHLKFRHTGTCYSGYYWFDLITVPGALIFQGDGDGFIFQRVEDMFEFFRGPVGRINPAYWQEKVVSGREGLLTYSEKAFRDKVIEEFRDACAVGVPRGTGRALREQILADDYAEIHYEQGAREAVELFEHDGFEFSDVDDWDLKDFNWWFLWACHAIVWGIAYYDTKSRPTVPDPAPARPRPKVRPEPRVIVGSPSPSRQLPVMLGARRIIDVHLPEPVGEVIT